ncbi:hypothetical protein K435DRAFT_776222 [Dendrothele bispora CBS 962.96]|uniref:Uncharacterized protein n=1 Tax=Dendrothele bispora (strain CBS 962.96) TaxID=1314807 RepID=A0A4S8MEJ5_DENBC|nr:hypothetical protein K435DRAFT_776222 [Dendrothele bispora CBS 962.96]
MRLFLGPTMRFLGTSMPIAFSSRTCRVDVTEELADILNCLDNCASAARRTRAKVLLAQMTVLLRLAKLAR